MAAPLLFLSTIFLAIYAAVSRKNRRRSLRQLATLAILWALLIGSSLLNYTYPIGIRSAARWLIWSHNYKAQVLAGPQPPNGELRNIAWDSGGMFAQDWDAFLVFDPTDSLAHSARSLQPCKLNGIPCSEVLKNTVVGGVMVFLKVDPAAIGHLDGARARTPRRDALAPLLPLVAPGLH